MGLKEDLEAYGRELRKIGGLDDSIRSHRVKVPDSVKNEVKYRQSYRCYNCDKPLPPTTHIHHKIHISDGGTNALDNLMALCPNCHADHHHQEQLKEAEKRQRSDDSEDDEKDSGSDMIDRLQRFGEDL